MKQKEKISTDRIGTFLTQFLEAGLSSNKQRLELLSLTAIRVLKKDYPQTCDDLGSLLSRFSVNVDSLRWHKAEPPPVDADAGLDLLRIIPADDALEPVLGPDIGNAVNRFICERGESEKLLREGIFPPRSLLLKGPPGTGKTMLAKWLAYKLGLSFVVLDLATSISSYLGKTGSNLRRSLDYARANPCLLLLDEFDSIAKRRDDSSEVGELKRIVNVLLKELEEWPLHSVLVAATNHANLLDPAIHRRFDVVLNIPMPDLREREAILLRGIGRFAGEMEPSFTSALAQALDGCNGSEVDTLARSAIRRHLVEKIPLEQAIVTAIIQRVPDLSKDEFARLALILKDCAGLSVRDIADLLGKGSSTIQYHLSKGARKQRRDQNA